MNSVVSKYAYPYVIKYLGCKNSISNIELNASICAFLFGVAGGINS